MLKEIRGLVECNPIVLDGCSVYLLKHNAENYLVLSREIQSAKDNIFVKKGDKVFLKAGMIDAKAINGFLVTRKSQIEIPKQNYEE